MTQREAFEIESQTVEFQSIDFEEKPSGTKLIQQESDFSDLRTLEKSTV